MVLDKQERAWLVFVELSENMRVRDEERDRDMK